jgi:hypothetical protein
MDIESFFDETSEQETSEQYSSEINLLTGQPLGGTHPDGKLTIFNFKTKEMILGKSGEVLKFLTNNDLGHYCKLHGINYPVLGDQINPKLRSKIFKL